MLLSYIATHLYIHTYLTKHTSTRPFILTCMRILIKALTCVERDMNEDFTVQVKRGLWVIGSLRANAPGQEDFLWTWNFARFYLRVLPVEFKAFNNEFV